MFKFLNACCFLAIVIFFSNTIYASPKKIGVIVPLEHEAMTKIVAGIKESLADQDVEIQTHHAHADQNIMLALIKQMKTQNIDLIMPIGTSASQMVTSHIKDKPIVCVAALPDKATNPLVTGVHDEIPISSSLATLPKLRNIAVIYSSSEKIAPEIEALKEYANQNGISLHLVMIQSLVELPIAVRSSPKDVQAFLILKDHLICSGINILLQESVKRSIPVIASDEGSVINGATMAIGVKEKDIGIESGLIAKAILQGATPDTIPYKVMDSLLLFINKKSLLKQVILSEDDILALKMPVIYY